MKSAIEIARENVVKAHTPENGFLSGVTGGFDLSTEEGRSAMFTGGLSGLLISKLYPEEDQRRWEVARKANEFGIADMDNILDAYRAQGELENFTEAEASEIREIMARKEMILRDLNYVSEHHDGDLDAVIDSDGKSMNDRWGYEEDASKGVLDLMTAIASNPVHSSGMIIGEVIKDLPLSLLGAMGLKGLKGASLYTKFMSKLNGVKPKALRNLGKVATPVAAGAVAGGVYEATYSQLNEGKVKWGDVQMGTEFGAAFGLLAGAGSLGADALKARKLRTPEDTTKDTTKESPTLSNEEAVDPSSLIKFHLSKEELAAVSARSRNIFTHHDTRLFPDLEGSYEFISVKGARARGIIKEGHPLNQGTDTIFTGDKAYIVWDDALIKKRHKVLKEYLYDTMNEPSNKGVSLNMLKYVNDLDSFRAFSMAREKARIQMRKNGELYEIPESEIAGANHIAKMELDNAFRHSAREAADKSNVSAKESAKAARKSNEDVAVKEDLERADNVEETAKNQAEYEADSLKGRTEAEPLLQKETPLEHVPEDSAGTRRFSGEKAASYIEGNKKKSALAAAAVGYAVSHDSEDESLFAPIVAVGAVLAGPNAYRTLAKSSITQTGAKARAVFTRSKEKWSIYVKQIEVAAQDLEYDINKRFKGDREGGLEFIKHLETPQKGKFTSKEDRDLVARWKDMHSFLWGQAVDSGLFDTRDGDVQFVHNYVPHLVKGKRDKTGKMVPFTSDEMKAFLKKHFEDISVHGSIKTPHGRMREYENKLYTLHKGGEYDVVIDPAEILSVYTHSLTRTIHNKRMINELLGLKMDGIHPVLIKATDLDQLLFETGGSMNKYSEVDHPSLRGHYVYSEMATIVNDYFQVIKEGDISSVAEGLLAFNNALKRVFVFGSLFHSQALFMSGAYSMGVVGALRGIRGKGKLTDTFDWEALDLNTGSFRHVAKESILAGLNVLNVKKQGTVNPGKAEVDKFLLKLGHFADPAMKVFDKLDDITWEFMHDRYKIAAWLKHKESLMKKGVSDEVAGREAAEFVNDAFGSLNWERFSSELAEYSYRNPNSLRGKLADKAAVLLSPAQRRWLNLGLFAPDWTASNLRILGKLFTDLPEVTPKLAKRIISGKWDSDEARDVVRAYQMYASYAARAGVINSAMWWTITSLFSDKEPTAEGLAEFWGGETSGKLDLGEGRSMVISKQLAEFVHWGQHPQHSLLNKMSIVPKTLMEGVMNKQWFTMKHGRPLGPSIIDPTTGESHLAKWAFGKFVPIVSKPLFDASMDWDDRLSSTFTGFWGFPQYTIPPK